MNKTSKIIIAILVIIILAFISRYIIFKNQFDAWSQGLERINTWETQYKVEHPNATKSETNAAFNNSIGNIETWKENYKQEHPNATDAQINAAFDTAGKN